MSIEQYLNFNKSIYENNFELFKTTFNILKEDPSFFVNLEKYSKQAILQTIQTNNKKIYHYFFKNIKNIEMNNISEILNIIVINHDIELLSFFLDKKVFKIHYYQVAFETAANLGFNDILYLLTNYFNNKAITNNFNTLNNVVLSGNLKTLDLFLKGLNFNNIIETANYLLGEVLMSLENAAKISIYGKQYHIFYYIVDLLILIENKHKGEGRFILYQLYKESFIKKDSNSFNYLMHKYSFVNFKKFNNTKLIELAIEGDFLNFAYEITEHFQYWDFLKTNHTEIYNKILNIKKFNNF